MPNDSRLKLRFGISPWSIDCPVIQRLLGGTELCVCVGGGARKWIHLVATAHSQQPLDYHHVIWTRPKISMLKNCKMSIYKQIVVAISGHLIKEGCKVVILPWKKSIMEICVISYLKWIFENGWSMLPAIWKCRILTQSMSSSRSVLSSKKVNAKKETANVGCRKLWLLIAEWPMGFCTPLWGYESGIHRTGENLVGIFT